MLKKLLFGLSLLTAQACWATDTYNPATNHLSIPSVDVTGTTYNDVVITVGGVIRIDGGTPSGSVDVYNPASNQLSIPSVNVNGQTYTNVVISVGQVVSVGAGSSSTNTSDINLFNETAENLPSLKSKYDQLCGNRTNLNAIAVDINKDGVLSLEELKNG
jgi:hypothetical protein